MTKEQFTAHQKADGHLWRYVTKFFPNKTPEDQQKIWEQEVELAYQEYRYEKI